MKLGQVLRIERERVGLATEKAASQMMVSLEHYRELEEGTSSAERWGPLLAKIAVQLQTPTARLLSESGKSADGKAGEAGRLIRQHRAQKGMATAAMADAVGLSTEEYNSVERGDSPLEQIGLPLLRFSEAIDQPLFNLFYPCGVPLEDLAEY
jgi:transcriptional regulator with XRE-family HTH domain